MTSKNSAKPTAIKPKKQQHRPKTWDEYFYGIAELIAAKSKDSTPVGVVLVNEDNIMISTGYNGLPRKVSDDLDRIQDKEEKLRWTVHAEANAICNAARIGTSTVGCTAYVTKFPCSRCAGELVQAGIKRVYCLGKIWENDQNGDKGERSITILQEAGIAIYSPEVTKRLSASSENAA